MQQYNKFWIALGLALGVLGTGVSDGKMTASEWVAVAIAFVGAMGVGLTPNKPAAP